MTNASLPGLTSSLAVEYGRFNVRVNALVPGYIDTAMTDSGLPCPNIFSLQKTWRKSVKYFVVPLAKDITIRTEPLTYIFCVPDLDPGRVAKIPLGRFGAVDEVAHAAAFLAKNPYASNCILNIDGGLSAA